MQNGYDDLQQTTVTPLDATPVDRTERNSNLPIPFLPEGTSTKPPRALSEPVSSRTVIQALRRHWLMILVGGTVLASLIGAGIWFFLPIPKIYAYAVFHISQQAPTIMVALRDQTAEFGTYRSRQQYYIKSRGVLSQVLNRPEVQNLPLIMKQGDPVDWLERQLQTDFKKSPESMMLYMDGDDEDSSALLTIIKAVRDVYMEEFVNKEIKESMKKLQALKKSKQEYEDKLNEKMNYLKTLSRNGDGVDQQDIEVRRMLIQETLRNRRNEQQGIRTRLSELQQQIDVMEAKLKSMNTLQIPEEDIENELAKDPTMAQDKTTLDTFKTAVAEAEKALAPGRKNDRVEQMKKDYAEAQKKYLEKLNKVRPAAINRIRDRYRRDLDTKYLDAKLSYDSIKKQDAGIQAEIDHSDKMLQRLSDNRVNIKGLQIDVDTIEKSLASLNLEIQNRETEKQAEARIKIEEEPTTASRFEGQRRLKFTAMGMIGSYVLLALGAIVYEARRRRVTSTEDIAYGLGLRLVGTLPEVRKTRNKILGFGGPQYAPARLQAILTESIDATRTMLLHEFRQSGLRSLMVTSAVGGEGKTSLSGHLALSLARAGHTVLLIDGDMRRPAAHRIFNQPLGPGLSEYLRGEVAIEDCVQETPMEGVWILPAGRWTPITTQCLVGGYWSELLNEVRERFDFVIVDSPPVLPVVDASLLGQHVDGVLMSVMRDVSQLGLLYEAQQRLDKLGIRILGVVVNGIHHEHYASRYYSETAQKGMPSGV